MTKINRCAFIIAWWAVVLLRTDGFAETKPVPASQPFLVDGMPAGTRQFWDIAETPLGWVAATNSAIIVGIGGAPISIHPPGLGFSVVLPHPMGLLVGGAEFCSFYSNNRWTSLPIRDIVYGGISNGPYALILGRHGMYQVDPAGNVLLLRTISDELAVFCARIEDDCFVFTRTEGVFRWRPGALEPTGDKFSFLEPPCSVFSVQDLGKKGLFFATTRGFYLYDGREAKQLFENVRKQTFPELPIRAYFLGDVLFVTTLAGGIHEFDTETGDEIAHFTPEMIGGSVQFTKLIHDELIVGTLSGLYTFVCESDRFRSSAFISGDPLFARHYSFGDVIGTTSGLYFPSGGVLPVFGGPKNIFSLLELNPGKFVIGAWGRVFCEGKEIRLPGREVFAIERISDTQFVTVQPDRADIVSIDGTTVPLTLPVSAMSAGVDEKGRIWLGTMSGASAFNSDSKLVMSRGQGYTKILSTGGTLHVLDADGHLFDARGECRATLPFHYAMDAVAFQGKLWVLAKFDNRETWLGSINLDTYDWTPFDVPLPHPATELFASGDALRIVGPKTMITVRDPARLASPSLNSVQLIAGNRNISGSLPLSLSADEASLDLQLPLPRLGPWTSPMYSIKVGDDPVEEVQGRVHIARLPRGVTKIQLQANAGGLSSSATYHVYRAPPGWLRWPAFLAYAVGAAGLGYGLIRFRVRHLQRRALSLEKMVDERTAELLQAQKQRETFFVTLSHEIRNPLNGVVGLAEVLANAPEGAIAPPERKYLQSLRSCAEQVRTILDDVLDFARIDRGEIQINDVVFDVNTAIEGSARAITPGLENCCLNLLPESRWLRGDKGKIRQVVSNLISNAIKYGCPPRATVTVTLKVIKESPVLMVSVENSGPDIPLTRLATIFDEFTRGADAVARNIAGSGLGLAVSRRLTKALQGTLEVASEGGRTCFQLSVPLAPAVEPLSITSPAENRPRAKVLAIEDMPYNRDVLGHLLDNLGYDVDWAVDGASALERILRGRYEMIFIDMALPDTSGPELARELLERSQLPKPPMIAVTAYSTPQKMKEAEAAGIRGFVCKPVSRQKLQEAIQQARKLSPVVRLSAENTPGDEWKNDEGRDIPSLAYIRSIAGENRSRFKQLATSLGEQLEIESKKIIGSAEVEDFSEIEKSVHRVQPLVAALGSAVFGTAINACRDAAQENDGIKLREAISGLEQQLSRIQQHLTTITEVSV